MIRSCRLSAAYARPTNNLSILFLSRAFSRVTKMTETTVDGELQAMADTGEAEKKPRVRHGSKLPDRWLKYTATGKVMEKVRIVAFKTPLKEWFFNGSQNAEDIRFDVKTLVKAMKEAGTDVGFVVDLTYTERYYSKEEWEENGIEYLKIRCPGHTVDESDEPVEIFKKAVKEFFSRNADNGRIVGVHCTHGLNRTGYMVCRYMIDELQYSANEAIEMFESCRGHAMERYKDSLKKAEERPKGPKTTDHEQKNLGDGSGGDEGNP